jgi:hypothetical protein
VYAEQYLHDYDTAMVPVNVAIRILGRSKKRSTILGFRNLDLVGSKVCGFGFGDTFGAWPRVP